MYLLTGILLLAADILSKLAAVKYLKPIDTFALWDGVFHLTYVENRGAAFGMLQGGRIFFILVTLLVFGAVLYFAKKYKIQSKWQSWGLTLISAGAAGNLIDRVLRGFVVDFLDFCLIDYPVFNLADIFVCTGAGLICIYIIFIEGKSNED